MGLSERAAALKPVEHLRVDALMEQPVEGFIGKKLWRQGQGAIGNPQPIEDHPSHGFARRDCLLRIGLEACVAQVEQT
jgi:hypothetical protein